MANSPKNDGIESPEEALNAALDFTTLRRLGLEAIIRTGSRHWTDYNEHDPGITILESIVYALTDLGYRTMFPIEDILAETQTLNENLTETSFYTARDILTVNPVSLTDFRKLIIDLEGVDNAWVYPAPNFFNPVRGILDILIDANEQIKVERDTSVSRADQGESKREQLIQNVRQTFTKHRNLAHDLGKIIIRDAFSIYFFLDLSIEPEAVTEKVVAEVMLQLEFFLVNTVQFYSLPEMMIKFDQDVNKIFNGPQLLHGFLPDDALKPVISELRTVDLLPVINAVPGVRRVNELKFRTDTKGEDLPATLRKNATWNYREKLPHHRKPVLANLDQQVIFVKKEDQLTAWDPSVTAVEYSNLKNNQRSPKLAAEARDIPVPQGKFRDITQYLSIQQEFPRLYGLEPHGPPAGAGASRLAQIRQLKTYLLIFDQILANYLSQLANLGNLFSWSTAVKRTYYFQGLETAVEDLQELLQESALTDQQIEDKENDDMPENNSKLLRNYLRKLADFREDEKTFLDRRNRFLTHILARFGRQLTHFTNNLEATEQQMERQQWTALTTKMNVLNSYAELSAQRNRAFNLDQKETNFPKEFSGLRRWVELLLNMTPESIDVFNFNARFLQDDYDLENPVSNPVSEYALVTDDGSPVDFKELMRIGTDPSNYQLVSNWPPKTETGWEPEFRLSLSKITDLTLKTNTYHLGHSFPTAEDAESAIKELTALFRRYNNTSERVYLVEHLLLRPQPAENYFGLILMDENGNKWLQTDTWYSETTLSEIDNLIQEGFAYYNIIYPDIIGGLESGGADEAALPTGTESWSIETENQISSDRCFNFFIVAGETGSYQVQLQYFTSDTVVSLTSPPIYASEWEAAKAIKNWLSTIAAFTISAHKQPDGSYRLYLGAKSGDSYLEMVSILSYTDLQESETIIGKWKKKEAFFKFLTEMTETGHYQLIFQYETLGMNIKFQSAIWYSSLEEAELARNQWHLQLERMADEKNVLHRYCRPLLKPWSYPQGVSTEGAAYDPIFADPFTATITAVVPDWPVRFQQKEFREALEKTLRSEAPAHLWLNVIWLSKTEFQHFRFLFGNWWKLYSQNEAGIAYFRKALLEFMMTRIAAVNQPSDE
ncbi:hypothetical protein [Flavilitoribacter nigricans]|uniref:Uncharacterized protein n=1 Tax=Flavilitoribacter nigricans (strain ATCC 23147 / DSM 23189 / NBRC 102662 / NCIMB 1420 / SS-2) TaxID=1122177 RepID=A0A2D0N135_FLAN2|nr:hypothetical protein [Flavilitoribacter nigricans]PHN02224.1 hypothetical protein CRP01_33355 [Flavilitoribacter nigricans DSM 23189 = NBRC 102662]